MKLIFNFFYKKTPLTDGQVENQVEIDGNKKNEENFSKLFDKNK
jgi:hypothetical protein